MGRQNRGIKWWGLPQHLRRFMRGVVGGFAVVAKVQVAEVFDCFGQAGFQLHLGFPVQMLFGEGDVGLALGGVVGRQRQADKFAFGAGHLDDFFR